MSDMQIVTGLLFITLLKCNTCLRSDKPLVAHSGSSTCNLVADMTATWLTVYECHISHRKKTSLESASIQAEWHYNQTINPESGKCSNKWMWWKECNGTTVKKILHRSLNPYEAIVAVWSPARWMCVCYLLHKMGQLLLHCLCDDLIFLEFDTATHMLPVTGVYFSLYMCVFRYGLLLQCDIPLRSTFFTQAQSLSSLHPKQLLIPIRAY